MCSSDLGLASNVTDGRSTCNPRLLPRDDSLIQLIHDAVGDFAVDIHFSSSLLLREQGFCGRMALLPMVRDGSVEGFGQSVVVDALTFLDDLEGPCDDGLVVAFQRIAQQVLQRLGVHVAGNGLFPSDLPRSRHHGLFIAHVGFDVVGDGVHLGLKVFGHLAELHEFLNLADNGVVRVTHCENLAFVIWREKHLSVLLLDCIFWRSLKGDCSERTTEVLLSTL